MQNNRKVGEAQETRAVLELKKLGYKILEKNFRCRVGEIDIIALHKGYLVFVEVKYRKTASYGYPWEAVSNNKQRQICKVARQYCYSKRVKKQIRFDIISICGEEIMWFQNAFEYVEF